MQKLVPSNDPDFLAYQKFQKTFGLDNNKVVVGFNSDKLFELKNFRAYYKMCEDMSNIPGVNQVISPTRLFDLRTDTDRHLAALKHEALILMHLIALTRKGANEAHVRQALLCSLSRGR